MADYILLQNSDDKVLEEVDSSRFRKTGVPPVLKSEKGMRWLPLEIIDPTPTGDQIKTGPVITVLKTKVKKVWTVRDKTAAELNSEKDGEVLDRLRILNPLIKALNDGTFVPGQNLTEAKLKKLIKDHL